jgi:hypothetical protein
MEGKLNEDIRIAKFDKWGYGVGSGFGVLMELVDQLTS